MAVLCALGAIGWFGAERDRAAEGNVHYDAGRYEEAETAYGEGLVVYPESERLRFNLGTAQYREGKFADAVATLEKLLPELDSAASGSPDSVSGLASGAAYNIGNARFRLGQQVEEQDPQQALALYDQALADYKRAMGFAPGDEAPKFNHEFVERHALALKERLEQEQEQQDQQDQPEQDQQQDPQPSEDEQAGGEQGEHAPGDDASDGEEPSPDDQQAAGEQPPDGEDEPQQEGQTQPQDQPEGGGDDSPEQHAAPQGGAAPGEEESAAEQLSRSEAQSLIDTARGEEVDPSELRPLVDAAGIGEPREDW